MAREFGVPVRNALTGLRRAEFYAPGSLLSVELDPTNAFAQNDLNTLTRLTQRP